MPKLALIHVFRPAMEMVARYYAQAAPELELTNLLDDGVLRLIEAGDAANARMRLAEMLAAARDVYHAQVALVTCSAISPGMLDWLREESRITVIKIDEPMCKAAVGAGRRIGTLVSFRPAGVAMRAQLEDTGARAGVEIEIVEEQEPEALEALEAGDEARHEELLVAAADRLARRSPEVIVLAQVSMSRLAPRLTARLGLPVLSSLGSSLEAVRARMSRRRASA